ncbi:hypothetical protein GCM10022223_40680 [Kineosporia mesophila]|uniref:Rhodanese domain-containing protein n=1 Tax=Kineosporia mesophila TaxID=566012 RepID=A0ABP6ZWE3_9ACTN|nr:rhodanese-like domain-containing protein [Kineosporia mesophila]MCD5348684.1 rhodanese-like domain-containing protein [Kineosporia mesophila]
MPTSTPMRPHELGRRLDVGEWVFDVRDPRSFAEEHLYGTVNVTVPQLTHLVGVLPAGAPFSVIGGTAHELDEALDRLAVLGLTPRETAVGRPADLGPALATYPRVTFRDLVRARRETNSRQDPAGRGWDDEPVRRAVVVDARDAAEYARGHLRGAVHAPLRPGTSMIREGLPGRIRRPLRKTLPLPTAGTRLWVHCADGTRASVAAGLLERAGHEVAWLDDDLETACRDGVLRLTSLF